MPKLKSHTDSALLDLDIHPGCSNDKHLRKILHQHKHLGLPKGMRKGVFPNLNKNIKGS